MLVLSRSLEQEQTSHRIAQLGSDRSVAVDDLNTIAEAREDLIENPQYKQQAIAHHANRQTTVSDLTDGLVQLAASCDKPTGKPWYKRHFLLDVTADGETACEKCSL